MNTNLYRARQRAVMAAIDSGDYVKASELAWRDVRTFAQPERSTETGDKKTLTPRRKCGIIKAIKRHVRRWKKKRNEKAQ